MILGLPEVGPEVGVPIAPHRKGVLIELSKTVLLDVSNQVLLRKIPVRVVDQVVPALDIGRAKARPAGVCSSRGSQTVPG